MSRKNKVRLGAAALAAAAAPFLITRVVQNPPDMNRLMAAAVDFTAVSGFSSEVPDFGNGSLILYKPTPPQSPGETSKSLQDESKILETEKRENEPIPEITQSISVYEQETYGISEQSGENTAEPSEDSVTEPDGSIAEEENPFIITQNISHDTEDLTVFNGSDLKVYRNTYRPVNGSNFIWLEGGGQVRNCTELDNDYVKAQTEEKTDIRLEAFSDQPQVLIMHTHACESYLVGNGSYQDENYTCRTTDASQSVVAVGKIISEKLAEKGICVIHDGTMHDYPAFTGCYDRAEETITEILERYPSIKVVLDVHRDGIVEGDGNPIAAVNEINGQSAAQVMIISAASDGYYYVPNYLQNLHFACLLQEHMESENPGITRPVLFQYCQYNQHLTTGSLLLEIGSQGNTLEEALYTGELIGESIGNALLSLC